MGGLENQPKKHDYVELVLNSPPPTIQIQNVVFFFRVRGIEMVRLKNLCTMGVLEIKKIHFCNRSLTYGRIYERERMIVLF